MCVFDRVCMGICNQQFCMDKLKEEYHSCKCKDNIKTYLKEMKLNLSFYTLDCIFLALSFD